MCYVAALKVSAHNNSFDIIIIIPIFDILYGVSGLIVSIRDLCLLLNFCSNGDEGFLNMAAMVT